MLKIKLPNIKDFTPKTKKELPYDRFYKWVIDQVYPQKDMDKVLYGEKEWQIPENKLVNVMAVGLVQEDMESLKKLAIDWCVKKKKWTKALAERELGWYDLQYGPKYMDEKECEAGYVYIDEQHFLEDKKERDF